MDATYIKFPVPSSSFEPTKDRAMKKFLEKTLLTILTVIFPKPNPDFDDKINEVKFWLLELDEDEIPIREIGLNDKEAAIMKMPFGNNLGIWTHQDSDVTDEFGKEYEVSEISKEFFEEKWNTFNLQ